MKQIWKISAILAILFAFIALPIKAIASEEAGSAAALAANVIVKPKDNRGEILKAYLASYDSPLTEDADYFIAEADRLNLDWKLVAAIAGVESTFAKQVPFNSYNAWGWGIFTGMNDGIHFQSWKAGITEVSEGLRNNYVNKGYKSIEEIGRIYAASPAWSWKVNYFINQIAKFVPKNPDNLEVLI